MRVQALWSFLFILLTVVLFQFQTVAPPRAHEYDHKQEGTPDIEFDEKTVARLALSLSRLPELGNDFIKFTMSTRNFAVTSCLQTSDLQYETKYEDIYLNITIKGLNTNSENLSLHPHIECDATPQDPKLEFVLSRKDLKKNGTKYIKIASGAAIEYFDIIMTDEKFRLVASDSHKALVHYYKPKNIFGRKDSMLVWLYPDNTLILYMPGETPKIEQETKDAIYKAAAKSGLTPLTDIFPEFESPITKSGYYYFVDKSGLVAARMETKGGVFLDNVKIKTTSYGLEGDVEVLKNVPVYAKKPGINE